MSEPNWDIRIARCWDKVEPNWRRRPPLTSLCPPFGCHYLKHQQWRLLCISDTDPERLFRLGGQRFGGFFCLPACLGCRACNPSRICIKNFRRSRSQRRTWNRNRDLRVEFGEPSYTAEKFKIFAAFILDRFGTRTEQLEDEESRRKYYEEWMYYSPESTREFRYFEGDRLLAVGYVDVGESSLYSHYFFYRPDERWRRLGIFGFLYELDWCRRQQMEYLYLGFYNANCGSMNYKKQFSGLELLTPERGWSPFEG